MKIKPIKANMTEVEIGDKIVLFSYQTPVAYYNKNGILYFKTSKKWSRTTTKHINQWTHEKENGFKVTEVDQSDLDNLIK